MHVTRRRFLGGMVTLLAPAPALGGCGAESDSSAELPSYGWPVPAHTKLARARYLTLVAAMDALIPGDDASPGATLAHAAYYLDQLLGAFDVDPPRIYAGGPYSGRHGGAADFSHFQALTRVEELRWRTYLEGSKGIPEREWNGPVTGLVERYESWLDALDTAARESEDAAFAALEADTRSKLLQKGDPELLATLYGHAVEGTYGDPVYGGNHDALGWAAIDYEGDRQPVGYSAKEMAHPEEG
jgi:Gluconate 2-dehydrogenase subunit 3